MKLQQQLAQQQQQQQQQPQPHHQATTTNRGAYKMADLTKKMSPDNPTQILTARELGNLRTLQRVITSAAAAAAVDDNNHSHHSHTNGNGNGHNNSNHNHTSNTNLVFSTIPLDGHALLIQPSQLLPAGIGSSSGNLQQHHQQQQQRSATFAATNGLRAANGNVNANANASLISSPVVSSASYISITNHNHHNNNNINHNNNNNNNSNINHINGNNNNNNNNSLSNFLAKATILTSANAAKNGGKIITTNSSVNNSSGGNVNANGSAMPATPKYVLLQPNGNGQFTTFEGPTAAAAAAAAAASNAAGGGGGNGNNNAAPSVGNIVLLATEPLELNGSTTMTGETARVIATATGDNDEELRPLAWLNDRNLIKGIVTTTTTSATGGAVKRSIVTAGGSGSINNNNICIVNASNAHELIEELPHHLVASEEHVATTTTTTTTNSSNSSSGVSTNSNSNNNYSNNRGSITSPTELKPGTQITTLSVSEFQQFKRFGNIIATGTPITLLPQNATLAGRKDGDAPTHIFGNIGAISATTTVHVGPSGTTTVVEYKSNGNFPTTQPRQLLSSNSTGGGVSSSGGVGVGGGNNNNATTITATNLSSNNTNSNYVPSSSTSASVSTSASALAVPTCTGSSSHLPASAAATTGGGTTPPATISVTLSAPGTAPGAATTNAGAAVLNLPKQLTTLPGGIVTVTNGNGTTNTIYQGQQQQQQQQKQQNINANNNNNNIHLNNNNNTSNGASVNVSSSSTTHHPHKKYLREKMNVLDHGGGGSSGGGGSTISSNANAGGTAGGGNATASTITVVASPASSSSSLSSSVSSTGTSASTAAVNGGNSPVAKSFYAPSSSANNNNGSNNIHTVISSNNNNNNNNNNSPGVAINYSNAACNNAATTTPPLVTSYATVGATPTANAVSPPITAGGIPAYTFMSYQSVASSSPVMSSPEPANSKDYYPLITAQQHQQLQQQQQQRNSMRSPNSTYSSYDNDSLKDFEISNPGTTVVAMGGRHNSSTPQHQQPLAPKPSHSGGGGGGGNSSSGSGGGGAVTPQKQKHPNNVPYDPFVHTHNKPPYSFSSLIFMAIEGSNEKALPVKEIYAWIMQHFPYFKSAPTGWKNSVRHNLSLNKSFVKVEKAPNMGKGSLWRVEPYQRQNLIQALSRSPYCPNAAVDKIAMKSPGSVGGDAIISYDTVDSVGSVASAGGGGGGGSPAPKANNSHMNPRIDPRLFPKLSKAIGEPNLLNDVIVSDVADDEHPSDYSTTNHNHSNNNNNNSTSNTKYSSYTSSPIHNGGGAGAGVGVGVGAGGAVAVGGNGSTIIGPFSSYESIERLARDCGADSIDDVNAATAMLALKHGPKVFTETFQNGAPVITSSPSEDHTYSAGGSGGTGTGSSGGGGSGSGASTPFANGNGELNGNAVYMSSNGHQQHNGCGGDNQSNYTSSDAAYESSEENHNITPEELEDQRRHREGVDALLSLSRSSVVDSSTSCSPNKRPSSTSVEEEHISACMESNQQQQSIGANALSNGNAHQASAGIGKVALLAYSSQLLQQQRQEMYEESGNFNAPSYYGSNQHQHQQHNAAHHQQLHHIGLSLASAATRKVKPVRSLRSKIKRKAPWMR